MAPTGSSGNRVTTIRPKSLRAVLFSRFLLSAVIPVVLVSILACGYLWREFLDEAERKNEILAGTVARQVDVFLREPAGMLAHGRSTVLRYGGVGAGKPVDEMLDILVRDSDLFEGLYVVDRTGRVVSVGLRSGTAAVRKEQLGIDLSGNDFLMDVIRTGKAAWSDSWQSPIGGKALLTLCVPVEGGALFGNINIALLDQIAKGGDISGIGVAIIDRRGTVLAHSDKAFVGRSVNLRKIPLVATGLSGAEATGSYRFDGRRYLGSVAKIREPRWLVLVSQTFQAVVAPVWGLLAIFAAGWLIAIASAIYFSRRQAGRIADRFSALSEWTERIANGHYDGVPEGEPFIEVRRLADDFREMAVTVGDREIRLRDSAQRFQALFNGVRDAILVCGIDGDGTFGTYLEANEYACRMLGYSREELLSMTVFDLTQPESHDEIRGRGKCLAAGESYLRETIFLDKEGREIPVEVNAERIYLGDRHTVLAVVRDVAERKRVELEKEELEAKLRQSQKLEAVGTLAGGIAHDFNNLLQVISGYTAMALMDLPAEGRVSANLMQVKGAAERAGDLVGRLLAFSRKESPRRRAFGLASELESVVRLLEFTIPKMIEIRTTIPADLADIDGDPTQISQVVVNLCTNARDAMPGGGTLAIEAENIQVAPADPSRPSDCPPGGYIVIRVTDNGSGMDEATLTRIFDPFFTTKEVGKGTGLGLSIVHGIVKTHGGWISCESEPGKGTTFSVHLPVAAAGAEVRDAPGKTAGGKEAGAAGGDGLPMGSGGLNGRKVLIADDETAVRKLAVSILEMNGYVVDPVATGEAALERFRAEGGRYDLVILDLGMPGMGGARCLEAIRKESPGVRVIVASGFVPDGQAALIRGLGATIIGKPYGVGDFEDTVRRIMNEPAG